MGASSSHFSDAELACRHCSVNGCTQALVDALEAFRALVGKPVKVDSAYRCPEHNAAIGGAGKSEHVEGLAADIRVEGMTAVELEAAARKIPPIRGIGRDDHQQYIHVDVRPTPTLAQWCYAADGKWCGYYPPSADHPA
jgi:uncharacterized protein YcbK (DUF882 family)